MDLQNQKFAIYQKHVKKQEKVKKRLSTQVSSSGLLIKVYMEDKLYECLIANIQQHEELYKWFDQLHQVSSHLQNQNNYQIKGDTLVIKFRPQTKASGFIQIAKFELSQVASPKQEMQKKQLQKQQQQQQVPQALGVAIQWVKQGIDDYWRLVFTGNKIVNKYGLAQIIGKNSIKKKNSFKVKICHFTNFVSLGIVDQNVQYIMPGKKNLIYYGNSKYFFNGEKDNENTGLGYTYDEIVEVVVDLNNGQINWKVNNEVRYSHKSAMISNPNIIWAPYICLPETCDQVDIIE